MRNKIPVRHHYIPRFILRYFCDGDGYLEYYDKKTNQVSKKKPEDIYVIRNMYKDDINSPDDPVHIEKELSKYESEVARLIRRLVSDDEIKFSKPEVEKLKLFFAIMAFRSDMTRHIFGENMSKEGVDFYSKYQPDGDLNDLWKRNLGELVKCRSLYEVHKNARIDTPIKLFMRRDTEGVFGMYLVLLERRGKSDFVLSDSYPTIHEGTTEKGLKLPMYYTIPISKSRMLIMMANGADAVKKSVLGLDFKNIKLPRVSSDGKLITIKVSRIYESEVKMLNEASIENAVEGYIL